MHYAILCYDDEKIVTSWTQEEDDAAIAKLAVVQQQLAAEGKLGPVARLVPTKDAKTLRKGGKHPLVLDGPYAETKEALLGFFLVDCASLDEALAAAKDLAAASGSHGAYEVRALRLYQPDPRS